MEEGNARERVRAGGTRPAGATRGAGGGGRGAQGRRGRVQLLMRIETGRPHTRGMQEQGRELEAALTLEGRTSQGDVWGPGQMECQEGGWRCPSVSPFFRPRMKSVLCVLAALSACCDEVQLWSQDQACALEAQDNVSESSRFPP